MPPPHPVLGHGGLGRHTVEQFASFGSDWLYVAVPVALLLATAAWIAWRSPSGGGPVARFAAGAGAITGLPAWTAASLAVLGGALVIAVIGFFWDVAWHIDIGRDEFLFSPPHVCLLLGLAGIGLAGVVGIRTATRDGADVGWRLGRWRAPFGPTAMAVAGSAALVGFGVDELWHLHYGLDVTMWSPPHLTMISAAAFVGIAGWLTWAEAGPGAGSRRTRRHMGGFLSGVLLIALTAWQLEFDLGVPQWSHLAQPVLIAAAGGFALTTARAALGRGGALVAVTHYLVVRSVLFGMTAGLWGLSEPRFPLYVGAAVAVEVVFVLGRRLTPRTRGMAAGLAVGTVGLASEWLVGQFWFHHPWQVRLLPWLPVALAVAVAAALLGAAFGRAVAHRPTGIRGSQVAASLVVVFLGVAVTLPRSTPQGAVTVRTAPAGAGTVHVAVTVDPPGTVQGADRWEVMAWQGDGRLLAPLEPAADGWWRTRTPVPVHGDWKANVLVAKGSAVGGVPVRLPADPAIDAAAVPVEPERTAPFASISALLLREAHAGPAWPGVVAYSVVGASLAALLGSLLAGTVALERRRRGCGWSRGAGSLAGRRIVLTGAASGIGRAARVALEAHGARVIGIDLVADRPDTLVADVTDPAALGRAVDGAVERLGGIDTIIANAGVGIAAASDDPPDAATRRVFEVNVVGAWRTIAAAAPHLPAGGRVIAVTSGLADATVPYAAAYTASKRGLAGYLDVLRLEARGRWTVTEVRPGYVATAIHEQPRCTGASLDGLARRERLEDAAAAVVAACETRRRRVASSPWAAAELALARHLPGLADRAIAGRWRRVTAARGRPDFARPVPGGNGPPSSTPTASRPTPPGGPDARP